MADLNALIAQGVQFAPPPDPFAQYAKIQQLEQGDATNQLNRMKMDEYQRGLQEQNALRGLDPSAADYLAKIKQINPKLGFEFEKTANEAANLKFTGLKTQTDVAKTKRDMLNSSLRDMSNNPSDANITAHVEDYALNPLFVDDMGSIKARSAQLLALPYEERKRVLAMSGATASDLGTAATALAGQNVTKRGQDMTAATAAAAQRLAQQKFAWEKTNPGYELKEDANGGLVGVNKRTLEAVPVTVGGAAVAPVAGADRGAVGVTDGTTPAVAGVRTQLMGKAPALTESQGNATAYGMRMLESNDLLNGLEKAGTVSGGRIKGAVEGTLTSLIPYQGANLAEGAGAIMNTLPGFLGGPNAQQQSYDQAKRNFITAVLRKESGASIAPSEFANEEKKYFPQAGEDDTIIKQKQSARKLAIEAMKIQAGPGAKNIGAGTSAPVGSNPNDPLNLGVR